MEKIEVCPRCGKKLDQKTLKCTEECKKKWWIEYTRKKMDKLSDNILGRRRGGWIS